MQRGISQEQLAAKAGLHQVSVSLIESGRRSVTLATIEKLARALNVQPRDLLPLVRM